MRSEADGTQTMKVRDDTFDGWHMPDECSVLFLRVIFIPSLQMASAR